MSKESKSLIFKNIVIVSLGMIVLAIFLESLIYIARQDTVVLNKSRGAWLCLIPGVSLLLYFVNFIFSFIDKISIKKSKICLISMGAAIVILQIIVLFFITSSRGITDTFSVVDEALTMLKVKHSMIGNNADYYSKYGNNNFITYVIYKIFQLSKKFHITCFGKILIFFNILCIDFSILFSIRIAKVLRGDIFAIKVLFLIVICPTTYLWLTFTYTNTFSMLFIMAMLYYGIKGLVGKGQKYIYCIITGFLSAIGFAIRPTTIIPLIAICIMYILFNKHIEFVKRMKLLLVLIVTFVILTISILCIIDKHTDKLQKEATFPYTHWIMMGLKDQGYVNKNDVDFTRSFITKEDKKAANIREIKRRIKNLGPMGYGILVANKLEAVWGIGTDDYEAFSFNGEKIHRAYLYVYGDKNGLMLIFCQVFRSFTFLFLLYSVMNQLREKKIDLRFFFSLTLFGVIVFFILWEANKKYSICFTYLILLLTTDGFICLEDSIKKKLHKLEQSMSKIRFGYRSIVSLITLVLFIFMLVDSHYYIENKKEYSKPAVVIGYNNNEYYCLKENTSIIQTFRTANVFNQIQVLTKEKKRTGKKKNYKFELIDETGNILAQELFSNNKINGDKYCIFRFHKVNRNHKNAKYYIKISCIDSREKYISFGYNYTNTMDPYKYGTFAINNQRTNTDLVFSVVYSSYESYTTMLRYIIICLAILLAFIKIIIGRTIWKSDYDVRYGKPNV